ncbi:sialate O-acetylesterase [soil metagenome]
MQNLRKIFIFLIIIIIASKSFAVIKMPLIFQSNMVLQRGKEISIWGFGDAGEYIKLSFKNKSYNALTEKDGKWMIKIPAQTAGGAYEISITGKSDTVILKNILFGDVWVCGGQSNMQYSLDQISFIEKDTARFKSKQLRIFTASIGMDYVATDDLSGGVWKEASAESIKNFSATAYFFARNLQDSIDVPIGLISDNLGATSIETWMSPRALSTFPQFGSFYKDYLAPAKSFKEVTAAFEKMKPDWERDYYLKGDGIKEKWYLPETNISDWKPIQVPAYWEDNGYKDFDGAMWFRKSFDLPENFNGETFPLALNQIDDYDIVWVNGKKVGEGYGNINWRNYAVPAKILQPKNNVIVVRVFDIGGRGGLYSGAIWGNPILLGNWNYKPDLKIDPAKFKQPLIVNVSPFSTPSILFNANIAPIKSLAIKGIIWYQGESNASRADEYRQLFPAFIKDWRTAFQQPDLPFIFVQLANYMQEVNEPAESEWAELRDAQSSALQLLNTGMASAIDIGDANDIHPKNKMDVGKRLALEALNIAYNKNIVSKGPIYQSMAVKDSNAIIHFAAGTNDLVTKNKYGYVSGFAIAGSDNKFYWAKAFILNNTVVVSSAMVKNPVAVRYAWSDNPGILNLYNSSGLPAPPFRTDTLSLKTAGKMYSGNPWEN